MPEEPTNHNEAGEVAPSTVDQQAPSVSEDNAPSTDEAVATNIPTANAPDPDANLVENPDVAEEKGTAVVSGSDESASQSNADGKPADEKKTAKTSAAVPPKKDKPAAKAAGDTAAKAAKKEKAPAVEDKPFSDFIQQDYLPAVKQALSEQGVPDLELTFAKQKIPIAGMNQDECWQVVGRWQHNGLKQFNLYFPDENIQGQRGFSCNEGSKPSTLEPFLIDERKITLDLMLYGLVQRLNGQKWLTRN